jgi:hypothetical protein
MKISLIAILVAYCFTRLPFFLCYLVPGINTDTFTYYYPAYLLKVGMASEIRYLPTDLPLGYPLFLYLLFNVPNTLIIIIQSLIQLGASLFLVFVLIKYFGKISIVFSILLVGYYFDSSFLAFEANLYTESLFISFSFILLSFSVLSIMHFKLKYIVPLFIVITILILLRSNGVVFLIVPFFVLWANQWKKRFFKYLTFGFLIQLFFLSMLNYSVKGYFFPFELHRYKSVISELNVSGAVPNDQNISAFAFEKQSQLEMFKKNLQAYSTEYASFYYSRLPSIIDQYESRKTYSAFDGRLALPDSVRNFILKDLKYFDVRGLSMPGLEERNVIYLVHVFSKGFSFFIKNNFVFALFIMAPLFVFIFYLRRGFILKHEVFLLLLITVYALNIIFSTIGHFRFQPRYILVFDIMVLLGFFLLIKSFVLGIYNRKFFG